MPSRFVRSARAAIIVLAVLGALNAAYTLWLRAQLLGGGATSSFCDVSATVSCSAALTDPKFTFFGIPFCEVALLVYPVILACAVWAYRAPKRAFTALSVLGALGVLFSAYSVYVQGWVIQVWCPLCLGCAGIISLVALLSWGSRASLRHSS